MRINRRGGNDFPWRNGLIPAGKAEISAVQFIGINTFFFGPAGKRRCACSVGLTFCIEVKRMSY